MEFFRGDLLRLARQARRLSQRDLAANCKVSQGLISLLEDGNRSATDENAKALARTLNFPVSFFLQDDVIRGTGIGEVFHRRRKSMSPKDLEMVHAWMNIDGFAIKRLLPGIEWPDARLPELFTEGGNAEIEEAAMQLRAAWYVPDGPVASVSELLRQAGVLILPVRTRSDQIDAIGQWAADLPPLIFINDSLPQDRLRMTMMHEIAHLCLHQPRALVAATEEIEREANQFAGAFLLPAKEIKPYLRGLTIQKLGELKRHWRVSMASIVVRAKQLNAIDDYTYKQLFIEISRNGWKKQEPAFLDVQGEDPLRSYHEIFSLYTRDLGYSDEQLAKTVNLNVTDVRAMMLPKAGSIRAIA